MSEKRFSVDDDGIYDTQEKKHFKFIAYDWFDCDIYECCEKLNEQQATIKKLQDLNKKWKEMDEQLREINKEIGDELKLWQDVHKEYDIYNINDFEELMKSIK